MLQNRGKFSITRSATYSAVLHIILLLSGTISMLWPQKENQLLMDVEIAGEGELRNAESQAIHEEKSALEEESKPIPPVSEETKVDQLKEESVKEEIAKPEDKVEEKTIPEESEEKIQPEEKPTPEKQEEEKSEEAILKKEEEKPKVEQKKKKKRDRKAFMDAIKNAEKTKDKKKRRRKLQEIAQQQSERKKSDSDFDRMLTKNSEDLKRNAGQSSGKGKKGSGSGSFGSGNGLSDSGYEMISSQIYPHWAVPSGVRDAENIIIEIHVELRDNGEVIPSSIKIIDEKRYATDYIFRAAADSARRAILEASPLDIPKEKIELFKEFTLRFNLKEALGG